MDLGDITYIDSIILGLFVEFYNELRNASGELMLANVAPRVKRILELTNITKYIKIMDIS